MNICCLHTILATVGMSDSNKSPSLKTPKRNNFTTRDIIRMKQDYIYYTLLYVDMSTPQQFNSIRLNGIAAAAAHNRLCQNFFKNVKFRRLLQSE